MVCVLIAGEIHLFSAEIFHDHAGGVADVSQFERQSGASLRAPQERSPLCLLCQIARTSSVRPAVQALLQKLILETTYRPVARQVRFSSKLSISLLARSPPLS